MNLQGDELQQVNNWAGYLSLKPNFVATGQEKIIKNHIMFLCANCHAELHAQ